LFDDNGKVTANRLQDGDMGIKINDLFFRHNTNMFINSMQMFGIDFGNEVISIYLICYIEIVLI
jgi:hypothetical protein